MLSQHTGKTLTVLLNYVFTIYSEYLMRISNFVLALSLAITLTDVHAAEEVSLICRGTLDHMSSDTRPRFGSSQASKQVALAVEVREERKAPPLGSRNEEFKQDTEKLFPGGLRVGSVTVKGLAVANIVGPQLNECLIHNSRITCRYEKEKTPEGTFASSNNMPRKKLPEVNLRELGFGSWASGVPKELETRALAEISLDRHTGLVDLEFLYKVMLPIKTSESEPFLITMQERGQLLCEPIPKKPKF
jgi:hypothetical protein